MPIIFTKINHFDGSNLRDHIILKFLFRFQIKYRKAFRVNNSPHQPDLREVLFDVSCKEVIFDNISGYGRQSLGNLGELSPVMYSYLGEKHQLR